MTVCAIIVIAVIVGGVIINKFLARRRNMKEDKLEERRYSNPNREEFSFVKRFDMYRGHKWEYGNKWY
jgi:hypothetical protein